MYQYITGIAFELTLIIIFLTGYLFIDGRIKFSSSNTSEFQHWQRTNGRIVKWMCIMVIMLCIFSIAAKYIQFDMQKV